MSDKGGARTTTMGTRVILRTDHSYIQVYKNDDGQVLFSVYDGVDKFIDLKLTQRECLALIEFLAVAATKDSEKEVIDVAPERIGGHP